jgi:hypothetical protein
MKQPIESLQQKDIYGYRTFIKVGRFWQKTR